MTSYRVNRTITDRDEVNGDYFEIESWEKIENGELGQGTEYVGITTYELKPIKKGCSDDSKFNKIYKGHAKISRAALAYIIGE